MKTVEVSESALESLKAMVEQLQSERDELLSGMHEILMYHANDNHRPKAFYIASDACAKCTQTQSICDWQEKMNG